MSDLSELDLAGIGEIIARHESTPGAMLPLLHEIQDNLGYVPAAAVPLIADALNVSAAEVHGVITYYHHFHQQPVAKHVVKICCAEACQSVGAEALAAHARNKLGEHGTKNIALEPVYCLGQCACGPALMVDDETVYARMTSAGLDALLKELGKAK